MSESYPNKKNEMLELNDNGKWLFKKYSLNWREIPSPQKENIKKLSERLRDYIDGMADYILQDDDPFIAEVEALEDEVQNLRKTLKKYSDRGDWNE